MILFHHAATNHKLDENWKISADVITLFKIGWHAAWEFYPGILFLSSPSKMEVTRQNDGHDGS